MSANKVRWLVDDDPAPWDRDGVDLRVSLEVPIITLLLNRKTKASREDIRKAKYKIIQKLFDDLYEGEDLFEDEN